MLNKHLQPSSLVFREQFSPHQVFDNLIDDDIYTKLHKDFPKETLFRDENPKVRKHNQRPHVRKYMCTGSIETTPALSEFHIDPKVLPKIWQEFVDYILKGSEYRYWISDLLDILPNDFNLRLDWHRTLNGHDVSPHVDSVTKLGSHLIYFMPKSWGTTSHGGKTIFFSGKNTDKMNPEANDFSSYIEIENVGNRSCVFKNSSNGWHGVTKTVSDKNTHRQIFNIVILKKPVRKKKVQKINIFSKLSNITKKLMQ